MGKPARPIYALVKVVTLLTQLGLSIALPLAGFVVGAVWLRNHYHLGAWVLLLGIVLGIAGAARGLWSTLKVTDILLHEAGEDGNNESEPDSRS